MATKKFFEINSEGRRKSDKFSSRWLEDAEYNLSELKVKLWRQKQIIAEAGSNTSTVTQRVVGGDEKGSLKSETVKYGNES
jgi:N-acetyl-gamma-glutamylphosphate reductase